MPAPKFAEVARSRTDAPAADWMRGAVAAVQRPLAQAEGAMAEGDLARVVTLLRPAVRQLGARLGGGRLWELWAVCGAEGLGNVAPVAAFGEALQAYQDAHDVAGMARCHVALGELQLGRGELMLAAREFGYAHELYVRRAALAEAAASLTARGEVALHAGEPARALQDADAALAVRQHTALPAAVEVAVRLVRAQALAGMRQPQAAARELLWAERLAAHAGGVPLDAAARGFAERRARWQTAGAADPEARDARALALTMARADALLAMGHPRRAAEGVARALAHHGRASCRPRMQAHLLRLEGESLAHDAPARATPVLQAAQRRFVGLQLPYWRLRCEIALLVAAHRAGSPSARERAEALAHARLQCWPMLQARYEAARAAQDRPPAHVPGAVRAPWVGALATRHTGRVDVAAHEEAAPAGLLTRLQHAWGRWRQASEADAG